MLIKKQTKKRNPTSITLTRISLALLILLLAGDWSIFILLSISLGLKFMTYLFSLVLKFYIVMSIIVQKKRFCNDLTGDLWMTNISSYVKMFLNQKT